MSLSLSTATPEYMAIFVLHFQKNIAAAIYCYDFSSTVIVMLLGVECRRISDSGLLLLRSRGKCDVAELQTAT